MFLCCFISYSQNIKGLLRPKIHTQPKFFCINSSKCYVFKLASIHILFTCVIEEEVPVVQSITAHNGKVVWEPGPWLKYSSVSEQKKVFKISFAWGVSNSMVFWTTLAQHNLIYDTFQFCLKKKKKELKMNPWMVNRVRQEAFPHLITFTKVTLVRTDSTVCQWAGPSNYWE